MTVDTTETGATPDRDSAVPGSYAIHVSDRGVDVWEYRVDLEDPGGAWRFVEAYDAEDDRRVSLDFATLTPPSRDGYWVYIDILSALKGEDSHGTAPLSWDVQGL
jgi:hypothetical protein